MSVQNRRSCSKTEGMLRDKKTIASSAASKRGHGDLQLDILYLISVHVSTFVLVDTMLLKNFALG
jgi:hypothetical protein